MPNLTTVDNSTCMCVEGERKEHTASWLQRTRAIALKDKGCCRVETQRATIMNVEFKYTSSGNDSDSDDFFIECRRRDAPSRTSERQQQLQYDYCCSSDGSFWATDFSTGHKSSVRTASIQSLAQHEGLIHATSLLWKRHGGSSSRLPFMECTTRSFSSSRLRCHSMLHACPLFCENDPATMDHCSDIFHRYTMQFSCRSLDLNEKGEKRTAKIDKPVFGIGKDHITMELTWYWLRNWNCGWTEIHLSRQVLFIQKCSTWVPLSSERARGATRDTRRVGQLIELTVD